MANVFTCCCELLRELLENRMPAPSLTFPTFSSTGWVKFRVTLCADPNLTLHLSIHVTDVPVTRQRGVRIRPGGPGWRGLPPRGLLPGAGQTQGVREGWTEDGILQTELRV